MAMFWLACGVFQRDLTQGHAGKTFVISLLHHELTQAYRKSDPPIQSASGLAVKLCDKNIKPSASIGLVAAGGRQMGAGHDMPNMIIETLSKFRIEAQDLAVVRQIGARIMPELDDHIAEFYSWLCRITKNGMAAAIHRVWPARRSQSRRA
ncbi:hypothetical protein [Tabrizicola sp.]|uniref:hypothetical protein n=1 Tax=Tabrizicola sp. TaxID=2005166 RepID=UPI003D2E2228